MKTLDSYDPPGVPPDDAGSGAEWHVLHGGANGGEPGGLERGSTSVSPKGLGVELRC